MFYRHILDLGFDYGATGGPEWDDVIAINLAKRELRTPIGQHPRRRYELGNRQVLKVQHDYLRDFHAAMRGRLHSFLYRDWGDPEASREALTLNGTTTTQLTRSYGVGINPYVRTIRYTTPAQVLIELNTGSGWVAQSSPAQYTLNQDTGIITWASAPSVEHAARWSGPFFVPVRFDVQQFSSQFIVADDDGNRGYFIGSLPLIEDLGEL